MLMAISEVLIAIQRMKQQLKTSTVMKWTYPVQLRNIPNTVFARTDADLGLDTALESSPRTFTFAERNSCCSQILAEANV